MGMFIKGRRAVLLGILAMAGSLLSGWAGAQATFSAKPITGKVVDAETGEPLPGVIVVAQWKIDRRFVGDAKALLNVLETVSDEKGAYSFPAWGPITLPPLADFGKGEDPRVAYFKSGYWPEHEQNDISGDIARRIPPLGEFQGNGKTVRMRKWDGTNLREYDSWLSTLAQSMPTYYGADWRNYPRMTLEIEKVGRLVQQQGKYWWRVHVEGFYGHRLSQEDMDLIRSLANEE